MKIAFVIPARYRSKRLPGKPLIKIDVDTLCTNIINALSGKISGVNITQSSGDIGSSSRITIRGISTIFGNSDDDSHIFTGHLTASGFNISASTIIGTIDGGSF